MTLTDERTDKSSQVEIAQKSGERYKRKIHTKKKQTFKTFVVLFFFSKKKNLLQLINYY